MAPPIAVLGLDLSLTATGVATPDGTLATIKPRSKGVPRLAEIRAEVLALLPVSVDRDVDLVVIEGYSFNSKGSSAYQLGELGGTIRLALHDRNVPFVVVSPSTRKKYATGSGGASKDAVLVACCHRLGLEPRSKNESDASWLRALTLDQYGQPVVTVPKIHRVALQGVTWPDLATGRPAA